MAGGPSGLHAPFLEKAPKFHWLHDGAIDDIFLNEDADTCVRRTSGLERREAGRRRIDTFLVLED